MQAQPTVWSASGDAAWRIELMNASGRLLTRFYDGWEQDAANADALTEAAMTTGDITWRTVAVLND